MAVKRKDGDGDEVKVKVEKRKKGKGAVNQIETPHPVTDESMPRMTWGVEYLHFAHTNDTKIPDPQYPLVQVISGGNTRTTS